MAATHCAFLWIGFHVQQFAAVFFGAADINQWLSLRDVVLHLIAEGAIFVVGTLWCFILCRWIVRLILSNWTPFVCPLLTPAIHHSSILVTKQLEYPEGIASPPVIFVTVENNRRIVADTVAGHQFAERFAIQVIAAQLIIEIANPIDLDRAG